MLLDIALLHGKCQTAPPALIDRYLLTFLPLCRRPPSRKQPLPFLRLIEKPSEVFNRLSTAVDAIVTDATSEFVVVLHTQAVGVDKVIVDGFFGEGVQRGVTEQAGEIGWVDGVDLKWGHGAWLMTAGLVGLPILFLAIPVAVPG